MRKLLAPSLACSALALGLLALQAIQPASARSAREEISPAEEQTFPYDANIPGCQDTGVLEEISSKFAEKEAKFWNTSMTIASYDTITRTAWRPYGLDFIPRRFCSAVATTSDGVRRRIDYSVRESTGFIGATWGVDYCVHGLDRNLAYAYSTACRMARP
jgi:hypothetical protein